MTWSLRKKPAAAEGEPPPPPDPGLAEPSAEAELSHALDTLGAFLRAFGRRPPGAEDEDSVRFQEECERWARHVLVRVPAPGAAPPAPGETVRRDWPGLRRFFQERRRMESAAVGKSLSDLRDTIVSFVRDLSRTAAQDRDSGRRVAEELARLQAAIASGSTDALREAALEAVRLVESVQEERGAEQRRRLEALEAQRAILEEQLAEAWRSDGNRDALTRIANRRALDARLEAAVDLSVLFGEATCLYLLDVDRFKEINDRWGHLAGDAALAAVADGCVRAFPSKEELVARFGGDEFAVVVPASDPVQIDRLGDRLLRSIRALEVEHEGARIPVRVSVGAAILAPGEGVKGWTARADRALYRAKREGRDRLFIADLEAPRAA